MSYAFELYIDLKKLVGPVPSVTKCWCGEYQYKWEDWETCEKGKCYLSECISF